MASSWTRFPAFSTSPPFTTPRSRRERTATSSSRSAAWRADATCYLASRIRESGKNITLYAVDAADRLAVADSDHRARHRPGHGGSLAGIMHRNIVGCGLEEIVVPILTTSVRAARLFPDGTVAFCFIDADHSYASVTADLRTGGPRCGQAACSRATTTASPRPGSPDSRPRCMNCSAWKTRSTRPCPVAGQWSSNGRWGKAPPWTTSPRSAGTLNNGNGAHPGNKVLFASVHSILDFSNGASVATLDVLQELTTRGFECQAFCTAKLDLQSEVSFEKMIGELHEPYCAPLVGLRVRSGAGSSTLAGGQVPIIFIRE